MSSAEVVVNVDQKRVRPSRKAAQTALTALREIAKKPVTKKSPTSKGTGKRGRPAKEVKDAAKEVAKPAAKKAAAKPKAKVKKTEAATEEVEEVAADE